MQFANTTYAYAFSSLASILTAETARIGSSTGGTIVAIVGVIAAIGISVLIPGLGLIIARPLAAGLVGAGAGGIAGGLKGAFVGSRIP